MNAGESGREACASEAAVKPSEAAAMKATKTAVESAAAKSAARGRALT